MALFVAKVVVGSKITTGNTEMRSSKATFNFMVL